MALARVVTFEGIERDRFAQMKREMEEGGAAAGSARERDSGAPVDPEAERALVVVFFETEDDYARGDEVLNAMPAEDTPGRRTSVSRYDVAVRMTF